VGRDVHPETLTAELTSDTPIHRTEKPSGAYS